MQVLNEVVEQPKKKLITEVIETPKTKKKIITEQKEKEE
jgi:hypothetical protein